MRPTIIAHRGFWGHDYKSQNTLSAFEVAWDRGWGVELDVRDWYGELVVAHDPVRAEVRSGGKTVSPIRLSAVLDAMGTRRLPLAVKVKACGLAPLVRELIPPPDWFFFDHAIPDLPSYAFEKLPYFLRASQVETIPRDPWLVQHARGIWLDSTSPESLPAGKRLCVVSDEVRGKNRGTQWAVLRDNPPATPWMLCTDLPDAAEEWFQ
jgi:glycerophosphoryl diester phosphodiesterase